MTNEHGTFIPTTNYEHLAQALADLLSRPCPSIAVSEIKLAICINDIFPARILGGMSEADAGFGTFLSDRHYDRLVLTVADLACKPNPFSEGSTAACLWMENEIRIALGVSGDVWPQEIYGDLVMDALAERQRALIADGIIGDAESLH